jgi:pimeloyl-ACP methyl ester carboxylesterase
MAGWSTLQFMEVEGHKLAYRRLGSGAPVVLLHGITTYSFLWRNIAPALAQHHDVIALDLLGCGDSDKPLDVSYALAAHAQRLATFVQKLELGRVHVVGHDLGGGVAQIMATNHQQCVQTVSVINTVSFDFWPVQPIVALRTPVIRQLLMALLDVGAFERIVARGLYHKERVTPQLMELFMYPLRTAEGRKAFLHFARCLDNSNLTSIEPALAALEVPFLILRGDADLYLGAANAERLHATVPGSRLERCATAGHFIQEDEPEWVTRQLLDFLSKETLVAR